MLYAEALNENGSSAAEVLALLDPIRMRAGVPALDASTIDLCLSIFTWAKFRKKKGAVKLHTLMDLRGNSNYKELQKITLGLMKKILVIKRPEEKTLTQVNWINYAHYEEGNGRIQLAFSDAMKPFLLHLKSQFTAIEITDLMQFTSIHAIRIYELLKQYQDIGERTLSIDEIKECCGVKDKLKQ